jgi:RimJ/RimL family protein N-acetyltransferase
VLSYVFDQTVHVAPFVASLIPECRERGFGACSTIGVLDEDGYLVAGLVYRNWCPEVGTIELSGAAVPGTNWLTRRTLQVIYDYPFYQLGCQMVIQTTSADNEKTLRINAALGMTLHYIKRLGGRDRDGVVATFTVEEWEASRYNANWRRAEKAKTEPQLTEAA